MASKRFKRLRKNKNKELDVDITSLLDILVILLVFLLKSYNPSDLKLDVVDKITIPDSVSKSLGHTTTTVQVSSDQEFWIDNKKVGSLEKDNSEKYALLHEKLVTKKQEQEEEAKRKPADEGQKEKPKENKKINLVFDQSLPYSVVQKIMHTSALAGFTEYKFIVQGKYQ